LWCSFCPSALILIFALAPSEKDLKKCKTSLLAFSRPSPFEFGIPNQPVSTSKVNSYLC
jgi:hypothetical protein